MADSPVLALDINSDAVTGILYTEDKHAATIIASHCTFLKEETTLATAITEVVEHCQALGARCHLSCGAEFFLYRTLSLPFSDHKKVQSILPFEIQDSFSSAGEEFIYDYLLETNMDEKTDVLVALLEKELLRDWLGTLAEFDLDPEVVTISSLPAAYNLCRLRQGRPNSLVLLDIGFRRTTVVLVLEGQVCALRSLAYDIEGRAGFDFSFERGSVRATNPQWCTEVLTQLVRDVFNTLFALKIGPHDYQDFPFILTGAVGRQSEYSALIIEALGAVKHYGNWLPYDDIINLEVLSRGLSNGLADDTLALATAEVKDKGRINFRKNEFAIKGSGGSLPKQVKFGALGVFALCVAVVFYHVFDYQRMQREQRQLNEQMVAVYKDTVAGSTPAVDPLRELMVKVNELKDSEAYGTSLDPSITVVTLLADISERIPAVMQVSFERFLFDRKTIRVRGLTDNFNTVDRMKKALEKSPYFSDVSIGSANSAQKGQGVRFELKLEL